MDIARPEYPKKYELAMIPIAGRVEDSGFTKDAWDGLRRYGEEHGLSFSAYEPAAVTTGARVDALREAVRRGAVKIVAVGHRFGDAVHIVHGEYPDVRFILIGGPPLDAAGKPCPIGGNTASIDFAEEQAGFLAGYAAVMEGHRSIAFLGGIESFPAIRRYGYGFLQGADHACDALRLPRGAVRADYRYCGTVGAEPIVYETAEAMCDAGAEVIFACGGSLGRAAMEVAERRGARTIGVDVDQSADSPSVLTTACKNLSLAVYEALALCEDPEFLAKRHLYDAVCRGVYLPMAASRFKRFQTTDYEEILDRIRREQITVLGDADQDGKAYGIADLPLTHVIIAGRP